MIARVDDQPGSSWLGPALGCDIVSKKRPADSARGAERRIVLIVVSCVERQLRALLDLDGTPQANALGPERPEDEASRFARGWIMP